MVSGLQSSVDADARVKRTELLSRSYSKEGAGGRWILTLDDIADV